MPDYPIQIEVMRRVVAALKAARLRNLALAMRQTARRSRRRGYEQIGSFRYSRPALHGIDRKLDALLERDGGFFVEAGGYDGYTQSNTYFLEAARGWTGVLVEPMSVLAAEARKNRRRARVVQCALVAPDQAGSTIAMDFGDLMSSVQGTHEDSWIESGLYLGWRDHFVEHVPAKTLSQVLDEVGAAAVDLLSLDVEGLEANVLRGLDLARHAPEWIVVEMHDLARGRAEVGEVLGPRYHEHSQISPVDVLYRRV